MTLKTKTDIPSEWKRLTVRKKTSVRVRPCNGVERFSVSWSDKELESNPELDIIIIQNNGNEYPCKKDIFDSTYVEIEENRFVKNATTLLVEIPEGVEPFEIETLEGVINNVAYPDFVAVGQKGELYTNTREFFNKNLEVI